MKNEIDQKKEYVKPEMDILEYNIEGSLLLGSNNESTSDEDVDLELNG